MDIIKIASCTCLSLAPQGEGSSMRKARLAKERRNGIDEAERRSGDARTEGIESRQLGKPREKVARQRRRQYLIILHHPPTLYPFPPLAHHFILTVQAQYLSSCPPLKAFSVNMKSLSSVMARRSPVWNGLYGPSPTSYRESLRMPNWPRKLVRLF